MNRSARLLEAKNTAVINISTQVITETADEATENNGEINTANRCIGDIVCDVFGLREAQRRLQAIQELSLGEIELVLSWQAVELEVNALLSINAFDSIIRGRVSELRKKLLWYRSLREVFGVGQQTFSFSKDGLAFAISGQVTEVLE